jgi:hypothetical protein
VRIELISDEPAVETAAGIDKAIAREITADTPSLSYRFVVEGNDLATSVSLVVRAWSDARDCDGAVTGWTDILWINIPVFDLKALVGTIDAIDAAYPSEEDLDG